MRQNGRMPLCRYSEDGVEPGRPRTSLAVEKIRADRAELDNAVSEAVLTWLERD